MLPPFILLLFSLMLCPSPTSHAEEAGDFLNLPDPPNTVKFRLVKVKEIRLADPMAKNGSCHASFRKDMNQNVKEMWQQCQAIANAESSDCQRSLFEKCALFSKKIQETESQVCDRLNADGDHLAQELHSQITHSQNTAQKSGANLNLSAEEKTKQFLLLLRIESAKIEDLKKQASEKMQNPICAVSSEAKNYQRIGSKISSSLQKTQRTLISFSKIKTLEAKEEALHKDQTNQQLQGMKSLSPLPRSGTTREALHPSQATQPTLDNPPTPPILASALPLLSTANSFFDKQTPKVITLQRWAPETRGSSQKFLAPEGAPIPEGAEFDETPGSQAGAEPESDSNLEILNLDPEERLARKYRISIDRRFTDRERIKILHGISLFPDCYHPLMQGLKIAQNTKLEVRGKLCVAGLYHVGKSFIEMSPKCNGIQVGVTVHEIFHHLAQQKSQRLERQYSASVFERHRGCPVSSYAQSDGSIHEDLAESGRLVVFPNSGQRLSGRCVQLKLDEMTNLLNACK